MYTRRYAEVLDGDERWRALPAPDRRPLRVGRRVHVYPQASVRRRGAEASRPRRPTSTARRVLALLGDSVTTDHISPAGVIRRDGPAAQWLLDHGVAVADFNSYGARRGNHEVMVRGTFGNTRLRNRLAPGTEGGVTVHLPDGEQMTIYDAAMRYAAEGVPLVVLAGKEYGSGSSRDWAAKGSLLLGVGAVIAESFERIHRSNLVGMGVLPLEFGPGASVASLGLTGREVFRLRGVADLARDGCFAASDHGRNRPLRVRNRRRVSTRRSNARSSSRAASFRTRSVASPTAENCSRIRACGPVAEGERRG